MEDEQDRTSSMYVEYFSEKQTMACHNADQSNSTKKQITTARLCKVLPKGYKLGDNDVYCGRGRKCTYHIGNRRFRNIIVANLSRYNTATTRSEKSLIIYEIVDYIRSLCVATGHGIGFVKKDHRSGLYYEAGDMIAREKVSQSFRDAINGRNLFNCMVTATMVSKNLLINNDDKDPATTTPLDYSSNQIEELVSCCGENNSITEEESCTTGIPRMISMKSLQSIDDKNEHFLSEGCNDTVGTRNETFDNPINTDPTALTFGVYMEGQNILRQRQTNNASMVSTSSFVTQTLDSWHIDHLRDRCEPSIGCCNMMQPQEDDSNAFMKGTTVPDEEEAGYTRNTIVNDNNDNITFLLLLDFSRQQQISLDPFNLEPRPLPS